MMCEKEEKKGGDQKGYPASPLEEKRGEGGTVRDIRRKKNVHGDHLPVSSREGGREEKSGPTGALS